MQQNFYFSYTYDLTNSSQRASKSKDPHPDMRFMWNHFIYNNFMSKQVSKGWRLPIIQGYVGHFSTQISNGDQCSYYLISRRCIETPGTGHTFAGMNTMGKVSNYIETEQIITLSPAG